MDHNQILSQNKKGENGVKPENKEDSRNPLNNKNGEDLVLSNMQQVVNRNTGKEPYSRVCRTKETDSVTLFTTKNYKVTISIALTASRMRSVNCVFETGNGPVFFGKTLSNSTGYL